MKPTVTILLGAPVSEDEARFLELLHGDLSGTEALILANFVVGEQQIDFVVVTPAYAALLELKNFSRPIVGDQNGWWKWLDAGGNLVQDRRINPWQQTLKQKYALSDAMKHYQAKTPAVPRSSGRGFFAEFAAFVCVYPRIHPGSRVTAGDHRVEVRSYPNILEVIRNGGKPSTWSQQEWQGFAEHHLRLSHVTLAEAVDTRVLQARERIHAYRERVRTILGASLPPLIAETSDTDYGPRLVTRLLEPRNYQLLGPSGSAKTFHLHHAVVEIVSNDTEIPLPLEAGKYRGGDFWTFLRQSIAPYVREDPKGLLDAIRICGLKPVVLIDAVNECAETLVTDLLKGTQAFALHFEARVILTSQQHLELVADLAATAIQLSLPSLVQKRAIYAHHAGLEATSDIDRFCAGFTNAYDLTIAGRCHASGSAPQSRVDLYDRYVRHVVPQHTAIITALLRRVAGEMNRTFTVVLPRDTFEVAARRFLAEQAGPLSALDAIQNSRLVRLTDDGFAFEHEQLLDYFRADDLREQTRTVDALAVELRRPRNQDVLEFLLPRFSTPLEIARLLSSTDNAELLSRICSGDCTPLVQAALLQQCLDLCDRATQDLSRLKISCAAYPEQDGRVNLAGIEVKSQVSWTGHEAALCRVIALNLEHPTLQKAFLDLVDVTEWTLRSAVHTYAREHHVRANVIWGEAVRLYGGIIGHGRVHLPCTAILWAIRHLLMMRQRYPNRIPIRAELLSRIVATPSSDFSFLMLFQDRAAAGDRGLVSDNLELVAKGLGSSASIVRMLALEYLQLMHQAVHDAGKTQVAHVRELLDSFGTKDAMVTSSLVECLATYGELELAVTPEDALAEMKTVAAADAVHDPKTIEAAEASDTTPMEWLADRAYGTLSAIFEEVFQWVYLDAYSELSPREKRNILCLAAQSRHFGFLGDWILQELKTCSDETALPIYIRHASFVNTETCFNQEAVATYILALEGCAKWSSQPPTYTGGASLVHEAWSILGQVIFWCFRGQSTAIPASRFEELWSRLNGPLAVAAADVLYQISRSEWRMRDHSRSAGIDLARLFPAQVRTIADVALLEYRRLPSLFQWGGSRDAAAVRYLIEVAGTVGNAVTIRSLEQLVEHEEFGADAIAAIQTIQKAAHGVVA